MVKAAAENREKGVKIFSVRDTAVLGIMVAALEIGKLALAAIPNVEIVTLFLIILTLSYGRKTIYATAVFVVLEIFIWGMGVWTVMYIYLWPLLTIVTYLLRKIDSVWFWSIFSAIYGISFGGLCSLVYLFLGGPRTAFAWWIAGIPFDIVHGISNFILMMALYRPLRRVFRKAGGLQA